MDEYLPRVYRFALRLTGSRQEAEDLAQETFLQAWRRRRQLRDPQATHVWLFTIAKNLWNDRLRRKARRPTVIESLEDAPQTSASGTLSERPDAGPVMQIKIRTRKESSPEGQNLHEVNTQLVMPQKQYVVLATAPVGDQTSIFVVQVTDGTIAAESKQESRQGRS